MLTQISNWLTKHPLKSLNLIEVSTEKIYFHHINNDMKCWSLKVAIVVSGEMSGQIIKKRWKEIVEWLKCFD